MIRAASYFHRFQIRAVGLYYVSCGLHGVHAIQKLLCRPLSWSYSDQQGELTSFLYSTGQHFPSHTNFQGVYLTLWLGSELH